MHLQILFKLIRLTRDQYDPVTDDDSSEDESIPSSRLSWQQENSFDYTHEYIGPEHEITDVLWELIDYLISFF